MSEGTCSRGDAIKGMGVAAFGLIGALRHPGDAAAMSSNDVNKKLRKLDLPPITQAPDGMSSLLERYGADKNRDPILVSWNFPRGWVVERPNLDNNFEAGTVSTGNYGKGDSAALFVGPKSLIGGSSLADKEVVSGILKKALSQKGENQFQSFKLKSLREGVTDYVGNKYYVAEFSYELLTGAGFTVDRRGFSGMTQQAGKGVQAVVAATTASRLKSLKPELLEIANSFRVYADTKPEV
ncbi:unnamed protein product [Discosporangium mesarthrocarpum]